MKHFNKIISVSLFVALLQLPFNLLAQDDFTLIGKWAYGVQNELFFHHVDSSIAYVNSGASLIVADFDDVLHPVEINKITLATIIDEFILIDNYLYISDQLTLWIYDVSNAKTPQIINSLALSEASRALYFDKDRLYQIGNKKILAFDLSTKVSPTLIGSISTDEQLYDLAFNGNYIYGSTQNSELDSLIVLNISDLDNPEISKVQLPDTWVNSVDVVGDYLLVGGKDSLYILNLIDPGIPSVDTIMFTGWIIDITVFDTLAICSRQGHGISIYDISDPLHPTYLSKLRFWASTVKVRWPYILSLAKVSGPIYVHDVSDIIRPVSNVSSINFGGRNNQLKIVDNYGFVAQGGQLVILDLNDPTNPFKISTLSSPRCASIEVVEPYCYMANGYDGWSIADVSDKTNPIMWTQIDLDERVDNITVAGSFAYLSCYKGGVRIYDISDPLHPVETGVYGADKSFLDLILVDSHAYAYERSNGLIVIDVSDKTNPSAVDSIIYSSNINTMICYDTLAYLGINGNSRILDISDPAHPIDLDLIFYWQVPKDFTIVRDMLYVSEMYDGLHIYDLANPLSPKLISTYDQTFSTTQVEVDDAIIYLLDQFTGMYVLDYNKTTSAHQIEGNASGLVSLYPNPAHDYLNVRFSSGTGEEALITISNMSGQVLYSRKHYTENGDLPIDINNLPFGVYSLTIENMYVSGSIRFVRMK